MHLQGSRAVKDVIQVYIKNHDYEYAPLNPFLCGFKKVELNAGEKIISEMEINAKAFLVVNDNGERILDSTGATIYVATSGVDERSKELTGICPKEINLRW